MNRRGQPKSQRRHEEEAAERTVQQWRRGTGRLGREASPEACEHRCGNLGSWQGRPESGQQRQWQTWGARAAKESCTLQGQPHHAEGMKRRQGCPAGVGEQGRTPSPAGMPGWAAGAGGTRRCEAAAPGELGGAPCPQAPGLEVAHLPRG